MNKMLWKISMPNYGVSGNRIDITLKSPHYIRKHIHGSDYTGIMYRDNILTYKLSNNIKLVHIIKGAVLR